MRGTLFRASKVPCRLPVRRPGSKRIGDDPDLVGALGYTAKLTGEALASALRLAGTDLGHFSLCVPAHRLLSVFRTSFEGRGAGDEIKAARRAISGMQTQEIGMNKAQVKGRVEQVKGKIKKLSGTIVGNKKLQQEGRAEELVGKAEAKLGDLKEDLKKSV
jgi:uncharacterized protein YjbJ (UPF0337 family)